MVVPVPEASAATVRFKVRSAFGVSVAMAAAEEAAEMSQD